MILETIYAGNFYPSETVVPKSEKYRNALKACEKIMDRLAERLSKEDYDLVEELQDQASIAQCEENECHFKVGFSAEGGGASQKINKTAAGPPVG